MARVFNLRPTQDARPPRACKSSAPLAIPRAGGPSSALPSTLRVPSGQALLPSTPLPSTGSFGSAQDRSGQVGAGRASGVNKPPEAAKAPALRLLRHPPHCVSTSRVCSLFAAGPADSRAGCQKSGGSWHMAKIKWIAGWVRDNLGADTPVHFRRFWPAYKLKNLPQTPISTLERARSIARGEGLRFVYPGLFILHRASSGGRLQWRCATRRGLFLAGFRPAPECACSARGHGCAALQDPEGPFRVRGVLRNAPTAHSARARILCTICTRDE